MTGQGRSALLPEVGRSKASSPDFLVVALAPVAVSWALSGIVILAASRVFLPTDDVPRDSRELLTPALAGVVLTAAVQTVSAANRDGLLWFYMTAAHPHSAARPATSVALSV